MEPAATIIEKFGGEQIVAEILGVHVSTVYRFTYERGRDGTGGVIPQKHIRSLLAAAAERKIALELAEFFP